MLNHLEGLVALALLEYVRPTSFSDSDSSLNGNEHSSFSIQLKLCKLLALRITGTVGVMEQLNE